MNFTMVVYKRDTAWEGGIFLCKFALFKASSATEKTVTINLFYAQRKYILGMHPEHPPK